MGKVKTKRQQLHTKSVKAPSDKDTEKDMAPPSIPPTSAKFGGDSIFSKVDIDMNALIKQMPGKDADDDARTAITSKSMKGMNLKKKDKRKIRQEFFMKKIDSIQQSKKEAKAKKKREKTAVVGDMKPLGDTLPTLDMLLRDLDKPQASVRKSREDTGKPKAIKKKATRKKEMIEDLSTFHQVLQHPSYQSNPLATISEHLHNKFKQDEDMDT